MSAGMTGQLTFISTKAAKPFLKWAGGKTQLLKEIERYWLNELRHKPFTYIEPFVGSGAVLFWVLEKFPKLEGAVINDINQDLINTYKVIATQPVELIEQLEEMQAQYHALESNEAAKTNYYLKKREIFNTRSNDKVGQSALFIFLNRTCFNGLYRVNRSNQFNVPIGSYRKPTICDRQNISNVHNALKRVVILNGDFTETLSHSGATSFFYFDPPYKPLSQTSNFNAYAKDEFNDAEQMRLKRFCDLVHQKGHYWLLSNSDVRGKDSNDHFFDNLYSSYYIKRIQARRMINANASKRGTLNELLITNYA